MITNFDWNNQVIIFLVKLFFGLRGGELMAYDATEIADWQLSESAAVNKYAHVECMERKIRPSKESGESDGDDL